MDYMPRILDDIAIYMEISFTLEENGRYVRRAITWMLREFIDTYGVNCVDDCNEHILDSSYTMTEEQIDIVFEQYVNPLAQIRKNGQLLMIDVSVYHYHGPYILKKFIEQGSGDMYLTGYVDTDVYDCKPITLLEKLENNKNPYCKEWGYDDGNELMTIMMKNVQKKSYSLFCLLKRKLLE